MVFDPTRKPNLTPAARHFARNKPIAERSIVTRAPKGTYAQAMPRLSLSVLTPKEDRSIRNVHAIITRGEFPSRFIFPDTSFITTKIQEHFWELGDRITLVFSEMTVGELSGWLHNPICNA